MPHHKMDLTKLHTLWYDFINFLQGGLNLSMLTKLKGGNQNQDHRQPERDLQL